MSYETMWTDTASSITYMTFLVSNFYGILRDNKRLFRILEIGFNFGVSKLMCL